MSRTLLNSSNNPTFAPGGAGVGTLNFATAVANVGFSFSRLISIVDVTTRTVIYAAGLGNTIGGSWNNSTSVLTLDANTASFNTSDVLEVQWDDPKSTVVIDAPNPAQPIGWPSTFKLASAATTNATVVKNSAGTLGSVTICPSAGGGASVWFVKIYDKATDPVAGDIPKFCFTSYNVNSGYLHVDWAAGVKFSSGIAIAIVTTSADATFNAVPADAVIVNLAFS